MIRLRAKILFLLAFLLFFAGYASAGGGEAVIGVVRGIAINDGVVYHIPLEGAKVSLDFTNLSAKTDRDGNFRINSVPPGKYTISVNYNGDSHPAGACEVENGCIAKTPPIYVFSGKNIQIPPPEKGSMLASYISKEKKQPGRLVFYRPGSFNKYLEILTERQPTFVLCDSKGKYLIVAFRNGGASLWDLESLKPISSLNIEGIIPDLRKNHGGDSFFLCCYGSSSSAIYKIDPSAPERPSRIAFAGSSAFVSICPAEEEGFIYAGTTDLNEGKILKISLGTGKTVCFGKAGILPTDLVYIPEKKIVAVCNHPGKDIIILDSVSLETISVIPLPGKPGRMLKSRDGKKIYFTITDKNSVGAINLEKPAVIKEISVGREPYSIKQHNSKIFVCSRGSGRIFVIDENSGELKGVTSQENSTLLQSVEFIKP